MQAVLGSWLESLSFFFFTFISAIQPMYKHPQCWQYIWTLIIPPPPSPAATTVMNKRYPALQTVISAMLLDSTYHVLTEIGACLSIPLARGSEPVWVSDTPFFTITSCNSQSVARVVSCHIHFTFIPFSLPSLTCRHTHTHTLMMKPGELPDLHERVRQEYHQSHVSAGLWALNYWAGTFMRCGLKMVVPNLIHCRYCQRELTYIWTTCTRPCGIYCPGRD